MSATTSREGYVPFRGYRTWYRIVGEQASPEKLPLLCLHGGPGAPSYYLAQGDDPAHQSDVAMRLARARAYLIG